MISLQHDGNSPADIITILGFPVAVIGVTIALFTLTGDKADVKKWAEKLAKQVKEDEERTWTQLLGGDLAAIDIPFSMSDAAGRAVRAPFRSGRLDGDEHIPGLGDFYGGLHPRRLAITGDAGSGKTVAAVGLILELIKKRTGDDPVPLRLSLAEWDGAESLADWVRRHLVDVYEWPVHMAALLVDERLVLPVLDGLDEMDPTDTDGRPLDTPARALAALEELNALQEGREYGPLVLTCRTGHYEALASHARLRNAARIQIDPLSPADAVRFLTGHADSLVEVLGRPDSSALQQALSTPWRLSIAAAVYADGTGRNPAELLELQHAAGIQDHLISHFITVASPAPRGSRRTRQGGGRTYSPQHVQAWLGQLASHLATRSQGGGTDLALQDLWHMSGRRRVRVVDAAVTALVVLPFFFLAVDGDGWLPGFAVAFVAVWAVTNASAPTAGAPVIANWRNLRTWAGVRKFGWGLLAGILLGMTISMVGMGDDMARSGAYVRYLEVHDSCVENFPNDDIDVCVQRETPQGFKELAWDVKHGWKDADFEEILMIGMTIGLFCGIPQGLAFGAAGQPDLLVKPRQLMRKDIRYRIIMCVPRALPAFLVAMCIYVFGVDLLPVYRGVLYVDDANGSSALQTKAVLAIAAASLVCGLLAASRSTGASRRYFVFLLCSRRKLPWRLALFLDWAYRAGFLRYSGSLYQFRHRELQQWLQRHHGLRP
ncbi:NACHT domain-containing protein [Streptomyces sp. TE33382]